ncbi:UPF0711 protein C18orf21 homolog isoform X1 [Myotis daubentonii]|uniref:UPF0711 protein C18orf21 homolog isoform X1 n=1 Tax=Myotis daubentonii TaxID=98922 RepID=UPI0028737AA2|nr:UPF0711 protein C18orf21 homolog isoform X1 [Myotis daubentonii]
MRQKHYLEAAARKLQARCPGQARYLLWAFSSSHDANSTFEETCPYCFQLLILDNSRVRLKPKPKLTPRIQKLLNREARNCTLSFKEAKIVKKYKDSKSVLLITCKTCNKTVKHHGKSRSFLSALRSNPATPARKLGLKTPERKSVCSANLNHRVSGSKGKSPALTFRCTILSTNTVAAYILAADCHLISLRLTCLVCTTGNISLSENKKNRFICITLINLCSYSVSGKLMFEKNINFY